MPKILKTAAFLAALLLLLAPIRSAFAQGPASGVSGILDGGGGYHGWLSNDGTSDQYDGGFAVDGSGALFDPSGSPCGPSYDYAGGGGWGGYFAVNSDGFIMGMLTGIQVAALSAEDIVPNALLTFGNTLTNSGTQYTVPPSYNGSIWAAQYFESPDGSFAPTYFQAGSSPFFWITGGTLVDGRNEWIAWAGQIVTPPTAPPPQVIYVNDVACQSQGPVVAVSNADYSDTTYYQDTSGTVTAQIYRPYSSGEGQAGRIWGSCAQGTFDTSFDVGTWDTGDLPGNIGITFNAPPAIPSYGPNFISWNNLLLPFYYTTSDAHAVYWNPGDADGDYTVLVGQDNSVQAFHANVNASGSYDPTAHQLTFPDPSGVDGMLALNGNGDPYCHELSAGMAFLFGSNGPGLQMVDGTGALHVPDYSWRRPDGSWGWKYGNLPNGVYLIADENGNFTAPPYAYRGADPTFYEITGWRPTNLYPAHLYVNGILCTLIKGSQYDSGAGLPRNGGASYFAAAYDLTVVLSWSWDAQSDSQGANFHGFVTGRYGQSSAFRGHWDGLTNFTTLTGGAVVSVSPMPSGPTVGPPQLAINGSALVFDAGSSSSTVNVYLGSLGQTLTIHADGSVVYTQTHGAQVTTVNGTYNANTHQFVFDGNALGGVAATDTSGHNLNTLGATDANGNTTLAGSLDVEGSHFTLGAWDAGNGNSIYGLVLSYTDNATTPPSLLGLTTTRAAANWLWGHPSTDGGSDQIPTMMLDSAHRLTLYDPANPANANVVLDPGGGASVFHGPVRIQPQGDIPMGDFHSSPTIP